MERDHIAVVGAGLAGANTCEQLRMQGFTGSITLIGAESDRPYDRPPLSKAVLLGERDDTTLDIDLLALDVQCQLDTAATGLHLQKRVLETTRGELPFDGLAIATGATPVRLPGSDQQHTVRSAADARRLRTRLEPGTRVVIIGASWIGAEVATAALARGCVVTCLEAGPTVAHMALGELGDRLRPWWHAVELRLGTTVDHIADDAVHLVGGEVVPADVVVVGVGVRPATSWLADSGLPLERGVVVDEHLRAADGVVALGDVAAWWSGRYGRRMRVEHWDNAGASAAVAAATLLGSPEAPVYDPVPYFWSDQFGHKVQYIGHHDTEHTIVVRGADTDRWSAGWFTDAGALAAFLVVDGPRDLVGARKVMNANQVIDVAKFTDPTVRITDAITGDAVPATA